MTLLEGLRLYLFLSLVFTPFALAIFIGGRR